MPRTTGGSKAGLLTRVPGQGVVGSPGGEAEALGDLAGAAGPAQQLGGLDLSSELGADDAQQHDGRGLLAPLLVRRGHLLGLGEPGQAACRETHTGLALSTANREELAAAEKELASGENSGKKNVSRVSATTRHGENSPLKTSTQISLQSLPRARGDTKSCPELQVCLLSDRIPCHFCWLQIGKL